MPLSEDEAKRVGREAGRAVAELKPACFEKATGLEVALEELASLEKDLILETMVKTRPDKEKVKALLRRGAETLRSDDVEPAKLGGFADSLENLVDGIDKKDLPIKGALIARHFNDIKGHLWEKAWLDVVNCECDTHRTQADVMMVGAKVSVTMAPGMTMLGELLTLAPGGEGQYSVKLDDGRVIAVDGDQFQIVASRKKAPAADHVDVVVWEERDRLHIGIQDKNTGEYYASWWDDEAREMIEDGFFKAGAGLENSVLAYAIERGIIAK